MRRLQRLQRLWQRLQGLRRLWLRRLRRLQLRLLSVVGSLPLVLALSTFRLR